MSHRRPPPQPPATLLPPYAPAPVPPVHPAWRATLAQRAALARIPLRPGTVAAAPGDWSGATATEALSLVLTGRTGAPLPGVCPVVLALLETWGDTVPPQTYATALAPLLPRCLVSVGDATADAERRWLVVDWAVRDYAARWLVECHYEWVAGLLRRHAPIIDLATLQAPAALLRAALYHLPVFVDWAGDLARRAALDPATYPWPGGPARRLWPFEAAQDRDEVAVLHAPWEGPDDDDAAAEDDAGDADAAAGGVLVSTAARVVATVASAWASVWQIAPAASAIMLGPPPPGALPIPGPRPTDPEGALAAGQPRVDEAMDASTAGLLALLDRLLPPADTD